MNEERPARIRDETDADESGNEARLVGSDAHVACAGEREPGPGGGTVDRGEHRLREGADRADVRVVRLVQPLADPAGDLLELLQILPCAEPTARAREDDGTDFRARRLRERGREVGVELAGERVVDLRPVERDRQHRPVP